MLAQRAVLAGAPGKGHVKSQALAFGRSSTRDCWEYIREIHKIGRASFGICNELIVVLSGIHSDARPPIYRLYCIIG
jgi:hypothetical protein